MANQETLSASSATTTETSSSNESEHDGLTLKLLDKPLYFTNSTQEVGPIHIKPIFIPQEVHIPSSILGGGLIAVIFSILALYLSNVRKNHKYSKLALGFDMLYENMTKFFDEILEGAPTWIKSYVASIFFVILFSNILSLVIDFFVLPFPQLEGLISAPTTKLSYTLAMALCSILIVLFIQFKSLGAKGFFNEYLPIAGKGYLSTERKPGVIGFLAWLGTKIFDIVLSLFLGILEIIGMIARVISLAARLFGNMFAHGVLLLTIAGLIGAMTQKMMGRNFPVGVPVIIYAQGLLVGFIQAFVFALLVSIFVKVAISHGDEH